MRREAIRQMQSLHGTLCERPLAKAPMTPVLSPLTLISLSTNDSSTTQRTASSRATDSAHPMSLPSDFQPLRSCHAAHCCPTITPIPQLVDASTQMSGSRCARGTKEHEPPGDARIDFHQFAHSTTEWGTWCLAKSFGNFETKDERGGGWSGLP